MSFLDILNTSFLSVFHDLTSYSQEVLNFSTDQKDQSIRFCTSALSSTVFLFLWMDLFTTAWTKSKRPPIVSPHWGEVYSVKSVFLSLSTHQEHELCMPPLRALSLLSSEGNLRDMQIIQWKRFKWSSTKLFSMWSCLLPWPLFNRKVSLFLHLTLSFLSPGLSILSWIKLFCPSTSRKCRHYLYASVALLLNDNFKWSEFNFHHWGWSLS